MSSVLSKTFEKWCLKRMLIFFLVYRAQNGWFITEGPKNPVCRNVCQVFQINETLLWCRTGSYSQSSYDIGMLLRHGWAVEIADDITLCFRERVTVEKRSFLELSNCNQYFIAWIPTQIFFKCSYLTEACSTGNKVWSQGYYN